MISLLKWAFFLTSGAIAWGYFMYFVFVAVSSMVNFIGGLL